MIQTNNYGTDTQEDISGVSGRLINQVTKTPTSYEVHERLFQFQNPKGYFGEIFAVADRQQATKICQSYINENIKKTTNYIKLLEQNQKDNEKIIKELKEAIKEIKNTIVWEIIARDNKLFKIKVGKYGTKHKPNQAN